MSSTSALENGEDLENVTLVRMEDVQPIERQDTEILETCMVDTIDYGECMLKEDDDSNIGSMVSIQSEEVVEDCNIEVIVPEMLEQHQIPKTKYINNMSQEKSEVKHDPPDSWPTLEILPGGVIKRGDKVYEHLSTMYPNETDVVSESGDMMYACAKCSQSFKYLFCLVKHVKWHEEQERKERGTDLGKLMPLEKEMVNIKRARHDLESSYKKQKIEVLSRIAGALAKMDNSKDVFN